MRRLLRVALREITEMGKSKAFLITSGLVILGVVALITIPAVMATDETVEYQVGVLGEGNEPVLEAATAIANAADEPGDPPSAEIIGQPYFEREAAILALQAGDVRALLVDGSEIIVEDEQFGMGQLSGWLQQGAATVQIEQLLAEEGEVAAEVLELLMSDPLEMTVVGEEEGPSEMDWIVAFAGLMLLYIAILLYGNWILTGVTEEKSSRVVEVLLSTLKPWQLLGGKIVGIGALGLTQFLLTITAAVVAINMTGILEIPDLAVASVLNLLLWFVLGFLVFAVLFGAAGSLSSRSEDAQNMAFPMSLIAVAGFFVSITSLDDPDGTLAVVSSFIPLTAPFVVPVRFALGAIPVWEYLAAIGVTVVSIVILIRIAGRIYAGSALRVGGKVRIREAWRDAKD